MTENPEDEYVKKEAFLNRMEVRKSTDFLTDIHLPVPKCLIVGDPDKLITVESELSIRLQGQISAYRSEPYFLELVPLGIDKAQSLTVLLEKLDMKRDVYKRQQFHFLQPELLGNENAFTKQFINPIKQGDNRMELRPVSYTHLMPSLNHQIMIFCDQL